MFLFLFSLAVIAFALYFYSLWVWYLGLIPLLMLFLFFGYTSWFKQPSFSFSSQNILRYSLYFAWLIILLSFLGLFSFLNIWFPLSFLWLIAWSSVLRMWSYLFGYEDGKKIFQFGYYVVLILFLIISSFHFSWQQFFAVVLALAAMHSAIIGFLIFIIGTWYIIDRSLFYTFFVTILFVLFFSVIKLIPNFTGALAVNSVLLMWLYLWLRWFLQQKPPVRWNISVRRILAGEKVLNTRIFSHRILQRMFEFIDDMPIFFRYVLEFLNILIVICVIWFFVGHRWFLNDYTQFLYWVIIGFFVGNTLILKKLSYTSAFQNLFLFLVVHFALYISFFSYFEGNLQSIVFWSIMWNIATSLFLFYAPKILKMLTKLDYRYWIAASILAFIINAVLLVRSGLTGELIFFLLLLYIGGEGILLFYGTKYVLDIEKE